MCNKLDTKNVINSFHNIWRVWKQHHYRVYSDALCVKDIRLHVLLKTLCEFLNEGNMIVSEQFNLSVMQFNVNHHSLH